MKTETTHRPVRDKLRLVADFVSAEIWRRPKSSTKCVWRDALGPGYAIGLTEQMAEYTSSKAGGAYHCA